MKLKKLILSGFKSFADRTEFEFDDGVSCVVGPNGCGKSNIVDAIKWVLGEQSAKSLRGSEMMDVLFNGSSARRAAGCAEVTLVFDNASGILQPSEKHAGAAGAVAVTRRLFRSGQSDYLINKTPCRLKDIREMFMDTGVGRDAYSLIEQGRVEGFLQASQEERRAIFDEAAGISKYKARKKEALRKLERVEQNVLRLNDILAEVEKRLRSIKHQAGKARNYQTYSERLKELRSLHFLAQYHKLTGQRRALRNKLDQLTDAASSVTARLNQLEAAQSATETESVDLERAAREVDGRLANLSAQITAAEQRGEMLSARVKELGEEIVATSSRCEEMEAKAEACDEEIRGRSGEIDAIEMRIGQISGTQERLQEEFTGRERTITELDARLEDEKAGTIDLLRRTAQLHSEVNTHSQRQESLQGQRQRLAVRAEAIAADLSGLLEQRGQVDAKLADARQLLQDTQTRLDEVKDSSQRLHADERRLQTELSEARERRSALTSRLQTLTEMDQRLEGVHAGVKRVLEAHREGKLPAVRGMLGDFIRTDTEHAALVEAALAGADQQLVVDRFEDARQAAAQIAEILADSGAVELACLDRAAAYADDWNAAAGAPRLMDHVQVAAEFAPLLWPLLGRTLVVESLADAAAAAGRAPAGYRFVTRAGEVLEADGRLRLGAGRRGSGVISRRSELSELEAELAALEGRVGELEDRRTRAHAEITHLDDVQQKLRTAIYEANTERVECESKLARYVEQIEQLERERPLVAGDIEALARDIDQALRDEHEARRQASELEQTREQRQRGVEQLTAELAELRGKQEELSARRTELRVSRAELEQKKLAVREALSALQRQAEQYNTDVQTGRGQIETARQRRQDAEAGIARAAEDVERHYAEKIKLDQEARDIEESRKGLTEKLETIRGQLAEQRKAHEQGAEAVNACRLELSEVDVRVENLIARAADEMGMELSALYENYEHDEQRDWSAVEAEIAELRGKIERLGNVNLDAIGEQEELEKRHEFLQGQLADVADSQRQLEDLIRRINKDSREMFLTSFQAIRENFQQLFRKLFGGGKADVILLDEEDVLESGIEIVARPPGKELRNLSLLSGGEKTMTALSLLFSMFRAKPSPFCLLDEVDAALDEANTERFGNLLREFVSDSQFVVITHAKRTMSMANVLYGVTMQEPGVSKRISVRFEEVDQHLEEPEAVGV